MSIEDQLPLARAIAIRSFDEQQRGQKRIAELLGGQHKEVNPLVREGLILVGTKRNAILLDAPTALSANLHEITDSIIDELGDDVFDELIGDFNKDEPDPISISGSQLRSMSRAMADSAVTSFVPTSRMEVNYEEMLRQVSTAQELGAEKGVEPLAVYEDDELYVELIRRSRSPREMAKLGIEVAKQFTPEKMSEMVVGMIPATAQIMSEVWGDDSMDQSELEEIKKEIVEDVEFHRLLRTVTLQFKRALRTFTGEEIVRFWGENGLDSLPKTVKATLVGSLRSASLNS